MDGRMSRLVGQVMCDVRFYSVLIAISYYQTSFHCVAAIPTTCFKCLRQAHSHLLDQPHGNLVSLVLRVPSALRCPVVDVRAVLRAK